MRRLAALAGATLLAVLALAVLRAIEQDTESPWASTGLWLDPDGPYNTTTWTQ